MKKTVKKTRLIFVYYIIFKLIQIEKKQKKSNNQILFILKKKIFKEYKDLKRVFQIELTVIVPLNKRRIYNIDLKENKISLLYFIYLLIIKELIILQKYL